jgi:hypothetical protein
MRTALHMHVCFWYWPVLTVNHITCIHKSYMYLDFKFTHMLYTYTRYFHVASETIQFHGQIH